MSYGDERYIGVADWSTFGRSFDAIRLRHAREGFWIDAFSGRQVLPRDEHLNVVNDYDWLTGLYASNIPRLGASFRPARNLTVSLDWLGFWMVNTSDFLYPESGAARNQNGYGRNASFDSFVGHEVDLLLIWRVTPWSQLQAGYSHFFTGDYIRQSAEAGGRATEDANWVYFQVSIGF